MAYDSGSYVSQSRQLDFKPATMPWSSSLNGVNEKGVLDMNVTAGLAGSQTTYSYRSGRSAKSGDPDLLSSGPRSLGDEVSWLKHLDALNLNTVSKTIDSGHTFNTWSTRITSSVIKERATNESFPGAFYEGPVVPIIRGGVYTSEDPGDFPDFGYYGPAAINATIPSHPNASLADDFGQILQHSFFPDLMKLSDTTLQNFIKKLADGYLNFEFGWKPFKDDMQELINAVIHARKSIRQFQRDSGKPVRRRYRFPVLTTTSKRTGLNFNLLRPPGSENFNLWYPGSYPGTVTNTYVSEIWFSGAYTYLAPEDQTSNYIVAKAGEVDHLLGINLTPADLWDLTPWSWLADWRYNIGTNLKNLSAFQEDNLVIKYGYLMAKQTFTTEVTLDAPLYEVAPHYTWTSVRKERIKASPYGFGKNPESFSDTQWAILAALGLSKAWKVLW